uniref:Uncharacterized protein n=1 Tax=Geospiza parvula TaxID=87175 RepID=A0A8U8B3X3_GEOPR
HCLVESLHCRQTCTRSPCPARRHDSTSGPEQISRLSARMHREGLCSQGTRDIPAGEGLCSPGTRDIPAGEGLCSERTRDIPAGEGLCSPGTRDIPAGEGLCSERTRDIPAGEGLCSQGTRDIPAVAEEGFGTAGHAEPELLPWVFKELDTCEC